MQSGWESINDAKNNLKLLRRYKRMQTIEQGAMAKIAYGGKLHSASPTEMQKIRRQCGAAMFRKWPGRCLTTLIALEGKEPMEVI